MDDRLADLFQIPEDIMPRQLYIEELRFQCGRLEQEILSMDLPPEVVFILESYISVRDELEFQLVKRALRFAQIKRGRSIDEQF